MQVELTAETILSIMKSLPRGVVKIDDPGSLYLPIYTCSHPISREAIRKPPWGGPTAPAGGPLPFLFVYCFSVFGVVLKSKVNAS